MADFKSLTVAELKQECTDRGLPVSGVKAVLIARLEQYEDENGTSAAPAAPAKPAGKKVSAKKPAAKKAAPASKKRKADDMIEESESEEDVAVEAPKEAKPPPAKKGKGSAAKVDQYYRGGGVVYEDADNIWDAMLMQVSIERNNNKYYVLQLISSGGTYDVFTRWGRVNEPGQNKVVYSGSNLSAAKAAFGKKFSDKTKNTWRPGIRESFVAKGSAEKTYTLMDMADADESAEPMPEVTTKRTTAKKASAPKTKPCTLDPAVQSLLALCFNEDTITEQLEKFEIDTNKMPVGRISKAQLEKGRAILEKLAKVLNGEQKGSVNDLTSQFYTYVPHDFRRNRPSPLDTTEKVQQKFDLINTLTDMAIVQDLIAKDKAAASEEVGEETLVEHPLDRQYRELDCEIKTLDPKSEEYKYVSKYFEATKGHGLKLREVFAIDRKSEEKRYSAHDDLGNRRLLWHGTNVAVVCAILKTGLRIMPHSGGRVGRGIYHASENSKSSAYVGTSKKTGIMFIDEVAIGKPKEITADDSSLKAAPPGYDSVLAQGWTDPDPSHNITVKLGGRDVIVPQSKAEKRPSFNGSRFSQCEWLVYRESQVRMRYMLRIDWPY